MELNWWGALAVLAVIWITGWSVSVIVGVFFNPVDAAEDKQKDLRGRLLAQAVLNWILWPFLLPALLQRQKLARDMRTGKRPGWIILAKGEETQHQWTLSDGTIFRASVWNGSSSEPAEISADYEDETRAGPIECRSRQVAPENNPPTAWLPMTFEPLSATRLQNDDDVSADEEGDTLDRYSLSLRLPRGKYALEFRVANRTGTLEELSALTLIVADPEDYNL